MVETLSRWPGYFTTYLESGLFITVTTTIVATALTIVWALVVTAVRVNPIKPLRFLAIAYIELFRGTPILVQLFTIFFGLSFLGLLIPAWPATVLALMLNAGGYLAESYRAGFQAVPQGQREAALAIGMSSTACPEEGRHSPGVSSHRASHRQHHYQHSAHHAHRSVDRQPRPSIPVLSGREHHARPVRPHRDDPDIRGAGSIACVAQLSSRSAAPTPMTASDDK